MRLPLSEETKASTVRLRFSVLRTPMLISHSTQEELQQRSDSQDIQIQSLLRRLDETRTRCKLMDALNEAEAEAALVDQTTRYGTPSALGYAICSRHYQQIHPSCRRPIVWSVVRFRGHHSSNAHSDDRLDCGWYQLSYCTAKWVIWSWGGFRSV